MTIRHAKPEDIDEMLRIYRLAKEYMDKSRQSDTVETRGASEQSSTGSGYCKGSSYVCEENGQSFTQRLPLSWVLIHPYQVIERGNGWRILHMARYTALTQ